MQTSDNAVTYICPATFMHFQRTPEDQRRLRGLRNYMLHAACGQPLALLHNVTGPELFQLCPAGAPDLVCLFSPVLPADC